MKYITLAILMAGLITQAATLKINKDSYDIEPGGRKIVSDAGTCWVDDVDKEKRYIVSCGSKSKSVSMSVNHGETKSFTITSKKGEFTITMEAK